MDRLRAIPSWFTHLSRRAQIIAAIVALVVVCGACGGVLAAIGAANPQPSIGGTAQATSTATARITQEHATATATHAAPTATSRPIATATTQQATCQDSGPVFGSTLAAFTAAYGAGQMTAGGAYDFPTDANQDAYLDIYIASGCVNRLVLSAYNATWSDDQTVAACAPYLPAGATQFNATGLYIDFHSPLGEIVEQHAAGSCLLFLSQG